MLLRIPVLLSSRDLAPAYRWRLVSSLYTGNRPLVEGGAAAAAVPIVCLLHTGWPWFAALSAATLAVLAYRMQLARTFTRQTQAGAAANPLTPEHWALRFTTGATVSAALWGVLNICVLLRFDDPTMQMFVLSVQAGWFTGACTRNAASPAAVKLQAVLSVGVGVVGTLFAHAFLVKLLAPFLLILVRAVFSVADQFATNIVQTMLSEQRLEAANARLTDMCTIDGLTGIGNRRAFDTALAKEWARAARDGTELGLLLIDVDYFKLFNDFHGHSAGDDCLRRIAETLAAALRRPPDFAGRYGGEEYVALLPGTGEAGAREVGERVREAVLRSLLLHQGSPFGRVTISIGAASLSPREGGAAQALTDRADQALYFAKQNGRNQVRGASELRGLGTWQPVEPASHLTVSLRARLPLFAPPAKFG
ncbi:MAG TPA: GGDEF domain-containing protein [Acetobacteraceae bacterium]|nr:GGDEF domain-containing protein [Acetobacteraceae bacterium]